MNQSSLKHLMMSWTIPEEKGENLVGFVIHWP